MAMRACDACCSEFAVLVRVGVGGEVRGILVVISKVLSVLLDELCAFKGTLFAVTVANLEQEISTK